jgi:aminopeptidase
MEEGLTMPTNFEQNLERYADLAVRIGLNLRAGQRVLIRAPIATAPLARKLTASAYQAGARHVDAHWSDESMDLARYRYAPRDSFDEFPAWRASGLMGYIQRGDAILSIVADNPDLLKDQDPELVAIAQKARAGALRPALEALGRNAANWLVISAPTADWAAKVFPNEPAERQVDRLWEAIFKVCRIDQPDPIAAWDAHLRQLLARTDFLNHKQYAALKYTGPGTDLTIGLPHGHIWASGRITAENGIMFTPNMPTEEMFTLPHNAMTQGVVSSSRPLNHQGMLIDKFRLVFAAGSVVEAHAEVGEENLRKLLASDDGARRLGEVALVPHSSPIAQSGVVFYNTLFDENAASHIALGRAYRFNLRDGAAMSEEQFGRAGGNNSMIHVDFMIGSDRLDIDGVRDDGTAEPLMRAGEWAFEA